MPPAASRFVTRDEFSLVRESLERLIVRVEILTQDLHALSKKFDARADQVDARFERIEERLALHDVRFDHLEARLDALEQHVDTGFADLRQLIETNHSAIVSALNQVLARR